MGFNILHLGTVRLGTPRFLDLIESTEIEKVFFLYDKEEEKYIKGMLKVGDFFNINQIILKKAFFVPINYSFIFKMLKRIIVKFHYVPHFTKYCPPHIGIKKYFKNIDFVFIGDNDSDGSNYLTIYLRKILNINIPIIRSYKETRFIYNWEEKQMLLLSNKLILPHSGYINFFKDLYKISLNTVSFADLDWRYSKLISYIKSKNIQKLSSIDKRPHVCILTGRVNWDPSEARSGKRYFYLPLIKELVSRGIVVHLHTFRIIKKIDEPIESKNNPYNKLAESSKYFYIESPLNLNNRIDDYFILKRYDAGILHNSTSDCFSSIEKFQQINIPNRLYEYQMTDVVPIIQKNTLKATEKLIQETNYGIIYNNYDELNVKLRELQKENLQNTLQISKMKSFKDFVTVFLENCDG